MIKTSLKMPKGLSEAEDRESSENTLAKRKRTNNVLHKHYKEN